MAVPVSRPARPQTFWSRTFPCRATCTAPENWSFLATSSARADNAALAETAEAASTRLDAAVVRLKADMSSEHISEHDIHPHFTNIQHCLQLARRFLAAQDTPNRQIILITDGLPTAHFESEMLYLLYPPDPQTEQATMREGQLCAREGITINIFLLPNWGQTEEDVQFAHRMAEMTQGRVFFAGGRDLDRFVVWDYVKQRRKIIS